MCHDLYQDHYILGGTASYASILTNRLGYKTAVLTSYGSDFKFAEYLSNEGIQVISKSAEHTTIFENRYEGAQRKQLLHQRASTLSLAELPPLFRSIPVVLLGPIADEVDASLIAAFPNSLVGATIQGWLRHVNNKKEVVPKTMVWSTLNKVDIVFVSQEDLDRLEGALEQLIQYVKIIIVTNGPEGAIVYANQSCKHYPVYPVTSIDPTGAGDIFAAAFLIQFAKLRDITKSMAYAHAAASIIVESKGTQLPSLDILDLRYKTYLEQIF